MKILYFFNFSFGKKLSPLGILPKKGYKVGPESDLENICTATSVPTHKPSLESLQIFHIEWGKMPILGQKWAQKCAQMSGHGPTVAICVYMTSFRGNLNGKCRNF